MIKIAFYFLTFTIVINSYGQDSRLDEKANVSFPKRFISKVEVLVGPGILYAHGNQWIKDHLL